ncbi:MAG: adenylate cyclase [Desulfobacteraceae bacterium 4572_89]|nr:MAG: adenylate cyclase [Desulfobacteraceae bacterium 4572_89]
MASPGTDFSINDFEFYWKDLDEEAKAILVNDAAFLPPAQGILPVLEGVMSFNFNVRTNARKSLETILNRIHQQLENPDEDETCLLGLKNSAMVSARIFQQISPEIPLNDMGFFLKTLLRLGDRGAYFIFKAVCKGLITPGTLKKLIGSLDDDLRLLFVDQYLQAPPSVRLKFGTLFRTILKTISQREPVIEFYARLFDRKRDADPFLNNINFVLRDPETIIQKEIVSPSPMEKSKGLKALSMMKAKIPFQFLLEAFENEEVNEEVKKVRHTIYSLIENSSMGLYPELFEPVLKIVYQCDPDDHRDQFDRYEAINAFKALVVTGKVPIYQLFSMIRDNNPEILPHFHNEIASLSRISFLIIQDIALNKEKYLTENFDINLACIFGMIKKRPERVMKVLKNYEELSGTRLNIDVTAFMEKIRQLLRKERQRIESPFANIVAGLTGLKNKSKNPKKFFSDLLQSPIKKKIEDLKNNIPLKFIDFQGLKFKNENLCELKFSASILFFNRASFEDCDLSKSYFAKAYFKKTVFYNVNMDFSVFDNIYFDDAVFINVSARNTSFKNCSFQGASLFNCNFKQADMTDAVFINARVSKTVFSSAKLSYSCFAHSRISGVSFATAQIALADFSGVRARFSRFPSHALSDFQTQGIEYNDRHYQLGFNDLPQIDKQIALEINMLIFCEFIHYGEMKFLNQNKLSLLTAYDIFKSSQADFFQIIPLLLHENFDFSDMGPLHGKTPHGISDYLPSNEAVIICERYTGQNKFKVRRNFEPQIEGLFTMGSVGSLAQTVESDIDYWVCINEDIMGRQGLGLFKKKLKAIEIFALEKFKIRITFFVVDILKARNNDFGDSTQESSGSAQSRLLKEEFYRTMIHVAGKLPLWAVLPSTISLNYHHMILGRISSFAKTHRYIDLGDIHAIPVNEYYGASIWQMFKWLNSPFKSVIKMALLEKYIHAYGKEDLLCNQYKNEWMNSGTHLKLAQNDSYIILLNNLLTYYRQCNDIQSVNLILTCFFLKLEISKQGEIDNTIFGLRKILLDKCLGDWGWNYKRLIEIGRFKEWQYSRLQRLSNTIDQYMQTKYSNVKKYFENQPRSGLMISNEDRKVLEQKVDVVFQEKPFKIKKVLLVSRGDRHFTRLHLKHNPRTGTPGTWELLHKNSKIHNDHEDSLVSSETIEEIGAWLINNSFYTNQSIVNLIPNATAVEHEAIQKLYKAMYDFFLPDMGKTIQFNELRKKNPKIVSLFISLNFYAAKQQATITDFCAVYLNSWGEMYSRSSWPGKTFSTMEIAKKKILVTLGIRKFPKNTAFYFSKGMAR